MPHSYVEFFNSESVLGENFTPKNNIAPANTSAKKPINTMTERLCTTFSLYCNKSYYYIYIMYSRCYNNCKEEFIKFCII